MPRRSSKRFGPVCRSGRPTRRAILARLALGDVSMNGRVGAFAVSQAAIARRLEMVDAASREIRSGVA
jgi:hypothetical protein